MDQRRLDDILNNALDELDDDESESDSDSDSGEKEDDNDDDEDSTHISNNNSSKDSIINQTPRPVFGPPRPPPRPPHPTEEDTMDEMLRQMEALLDIPSNGTPTSTHDGVHTKIKTSTTSNARNNNGKNNDEEGVPSSSSTTRSNTHPKSSSSSSRSEIEMDSTVTRLLQELLRPPINTDSEKLRNQPDPNQFGGIGEDMMNQMAMGWEDAMKGGTRGGCGADSSVEHVVDGMLRQLLGKELMYEPMKDICDKFPEWLVEHKTELNEEEYQRYGRQYQCFHQIVEVYEHNPDNFARLSELMQDIQEYGQPPIELIRELAPGLEFDERGMPKMDAFRSNLSGMDPNSLPFGKDGDAQCCMMWMRPFPESEISECLTYSLSLSFSRLSIIIDPLCVFRLFPCS